MHQLSQFSLRNRALIALMTVVVAIFGGISFTSLKQELIPSIEIPQLAVVTTLQGASAAVVAADVSEPLEKALQTVPGLQGTTSTSSTGLSVVMAEFEFGSDTAKLEQKMTQAIGRVRSTLPEGVDPSVMAISLDDFPVVQLAVATDEPAKLAGQLADIVVPELERQDGVAAATVLGAPGERISITPRPAALAARGLSPPAPGSPRAPNRGLVPAGTIDEDGATLPVQVGSRLESVESIKGLPLVGAANPVVVSEVADVALVEDPTTSYSLVNGRQALTLSVTKLPDANTVDVSRAVQDVLPDLEAKVPGAKISVLLDQAPYIQESISSLATEGLLGLAMAILVILVFLRSVRATLVTAISIPVSLLIAFVGMWAAGFTLNILSLGGLTIAIGRIVDDSIVVIENVERHMGMGKPRRETIVDAVREVGGAITASTVTTVAVFLPIAMVGGMAGVLFRPFAVTVALAMGASLLVALTIVPVLAYWFLKWKGSPRRAADGEAAQGWIQKGYATTIDWVLRHRWATVAGAVAILVGTIALTPLLKTNFIGDSGQNEVNVTQRVVAGTSLDKQLEAATVVDKALRDVEGVEQVATTIGSTGQMAMLRGGAESITYAITTQADADQAAISDRVRQTMESHARAEDLTVSSAGGAGMSNDVEISVTGADRKAVAGATGKIADAMRDLPEVQQVGTSLTDARPTVEVRIDRAAAARARLTEAALAQSVAGMVAPQQIGAVTLAGASVNVYLTPADPAGSVAALRTLPMGTGMTLDDVADVNVVDGPVSITTANGARNQMVTVTPRSEDLGKASASVATALDGVDLPDGVQADIGGVTAQQDEAFSQLGIAMLVAILIVYVVMVATFRSLLQPLLLLVSVPLAATGAILLQVATGIPLGVPSLIGVLMLIGIVVTNAIVLIDLVKQYRDEGAPMAEALRRGALHRVRPIIMTALATILALAPMAIGLTGHGGFISKPLAIVVIGGLLSSTFMTLVVLPALYHLVESVGRPQAKGPQQQVEGAGSPPAS